MLKRLRELRIISPLFKIYEFCIRMAYYKNPYLVE